MFLNLRQQQNVAMVSGPIAYIENFVLWPYPTLFLQKNRNFTFVIIIYNIIVSYDIGSLPAKYTQKIDAIISEQTV